MSEYESYIVQYRESHFQEQESMSGSKVARESQDHTKSLKLAMIKQRYHCVNVELIRSPRFLSDLIFVPTMLPEAKCHINAHLMCPMLFKRVWTVHPSVSGKVTDKQESPSLPRIAFVIPSFIEEKASTIKKKKKSHDGYSIIFYRSTKHLSHTLNAVRMIIHHAHDFTHRRI